VRILSYSAGADTGGQGIRLKRAFDNHTDHTFRSLTRSTNYIQYPRDLAVTERVRAIRQADVIHAHASFVQLERVEKPMVIHHHGTGFRNNPEKHLERMRQRNVHGLAATLDLWLIAPLELTWLPAPYDIEWLASFRQPKDGPLRIGHAPTERKIKSTDAFMAAVAKLRKTHDVELVMIERQSWDKCLRQKGSVDVFYDQVILGYGNNAIEAWGMGIPVICGGQPDTLAEMRNRFGELPFYEATEATIYDALAAMTDEKTRAEWSAKGHAHAERFHSEQAVVELIEPVYLDAIARGPAIPLDMSLVAGGGRARGPRRHGRR
jgi:hypothetical protein